MDRELHSGPVLQKLDTIKQSTLLNAKCSLISFLPICPFTSSYNSNICPIGKPYTVQENES